MAQITADRIAGYMAAEADLPPGQPRFRYLICSSPRTGSSLLAAGLRRTGEAGTPHEYFNGRYVEAYRRRIGDPGLGLGAYQDFLLRHRCTANGVFGAKMHFDQLQALARNRAAQNAFLAPFDRLILTRRANQVAQAVSFARALATDIWNVQTEDQAAAARRTPAAYDHAAIARALAMVAAQDAAWISLSEAIGRPFLTVPYEVLCRNFPAALAAAAAHLDIPPPRDGIGISDEFSKLGDETNLDWERRFRAESGQVMAQGPNQSS